MADDRMTVTYTYKVKRKLDGEWVGPFTVTLNPKEPRLATAVFWNYQKSGLTSEHMETVGVEIVDMRDEDGNVL